MKEANSSMELLSEDRGAIRILTLNRPAKHNATNSTLTQALLDALRIADDDETINTVVLTGAGRSFCAGADTTEFSALTPDSPAAVLARADLTSALHLVFSQMRKPVIAAVRGYALGGGAGLAIACDLVVIAEDARFGYPELKHGIVAAVVLANLVRQVGRKHAFDLVSSGKPIDGHRALTLGLANRCVPAEQVLEQALEMAQVLVAWSPIALQTTKRTFHRAADAGLGQALAIGRDANVMMRAFNKAKA